MVVSSNRESFIDILSRDVRYCISDGIHEPYGVIYIQTIESCSLGCSYDACVPAGDDCRFCIDELTRLFLIRADPKIRVR